MNRAQSYWNPLALFTFYAELVTDEAKKKKKTRIPLRNEICFRNYVIYCAIGNGVHWLFNLKFERTVLAGRRNAFCDRSGNVKPDFQQNRIRSKTVFAANSQDSIGGVVSALGADNFRKTILTIPDYWSMVRLTRGSVKADRNRTIDPRQWTTWKTTNIILRPVKNTPDHCTTVWYALIQSDGSTTVEHDSYVTRTIIVIGRLTTYERTNK